MEDEKVKKFCHKDAEILTPGFSVTFNGALLKHNADSLSLIQPLHASKSNLLDVDNLTKETFVCERGEGVYIATMSRPDLAFGLSKCAQIQCPTREHAQLRNEILHDIKINPTVGLTYSKVDGASAKLFVFADASFASTEGGTSQLGFVITMTDSNGKSSILHYSSTKSRRVTRKVLAAELYAMAHAFDVRSTPKLTLSDIHGRKVAMAMYTDPKSLFYFLVGVTSPTEKSLFLDLTGLREAYEVREIDEVLWIPSQNNPADGLTKGKKCEALRKLMLEGTADIAANSWTQWGIRGEEGNGTNVEKERVSE